MKVFNTMKLYLLWGYFVGLFELDHVTIIQYHRQRSDLTLYDMYVHQGAVRQKQVGEAYKADGRGSSVDICCFL